MDGALCVKPSVLAHEDVLHLVGLLDLIVANGHVYPQMDYVKGGAGYKQPVVLYRNNRDRTFEDITAAAGLDKLPPESRRGAAFGDINNDGKIDILILNVGQPPTLLLNRTQTSNHAVLFKLIGTKSNKAAIGARAYRGVRPRRGHVDDRRRLHVADDRAGDVCGIARKRPAVVAPVVQSCRE